MSKKRREDENALVERAADQLARFFVMFLDDIETKNADPGLPGQPIWSEKA